MQTDRPLKVAHLLLAGGIDGIGLHVRDIAVAQLESGTVRPVVVTCPSADYAGRLRAAGVPATYLPSARILPALVRRRGLGLLPDDVDLVHLHGHRASQLVLAARHLPGDGLAGRPLIATCHGFVADSLRRRVRRRTEILSYRALNSLITTSQEQADLVRTVYRRLPVSYVPNGVFPVPASVEPRESVLARYGIPSDSPVIGSIGRLSSEKRHDLLLSAGRLIVSAEPRTQILVLGEGRERPRLEALARRLGLADQVHFPGLVADVPAVCSAFSLLLHTSDMEGTPRVVLEAMTAGVPVVGTAVGGVPDLVQDGVTGFLLPPGDARGLAEASLRILRDPALADRMGRQARRRVEESFTTAMMAERVEELYRSALTSTAAGAA